MHFWRRAPKATSSGYLLPATDDCILVLGSDLAIDRVEIHWPSGVNRSFAIKKPTRDSDWRTGAIGSGQVRRKLRFSYALRNTAKNEPTSPRRSSRALLFRRVEQKPRSFFWSTQWMRNIEGRKAVTLAGDLGA